MLQVLSGRTKHPAFGMNALLSVSSTSHLQLGVEDLIGTGWQPHWTERAQPLPVLWTMWTTKY